MDRHGLQLITGGWSCISPWTLLFQRGKHEYMPRFKVIEKKHKGRVPVRIGGSIKGSTVKFGTFGMRLRTEGCRITALQMKEADNAIMRYVRKLENGKLFRRLTTNIAVCVKGNETRMGKGKGAFDHWMCRVPTGKVIFEMSGDNLHERVAREAFRKAGTKLPGCYEFVTQNSLARCGLHTFKDPNEKIDVPISSRTEKRLQNRDIAKLPEYYLYRGR